jgi:DNA anti-recombination protein RmuC
MDQIKKLKEDLADLEKSFSNKEKELDDFMATFASDRSKYDDAADKKAEALENEAKAIKSQIAEKIPNWQSWSGWSEWVPKDWSVSESRINLMWQPIRKPTKPEP